MDDFEMIEMGDSDARRSYLTNLEYTVEKKSYPDCDPDLIYELVNAEFIRDEAVERGFTDFAEETQRYIDDTLEPLGGLEPQQKPLGDFSEEEASLYETAHAFQDIIGTFTEEDGEIIHAGDIANRFIEGEVREEVHSALECFEDWYRDRLELMLADVEADQVEGSQRSYDKNEFEKVAVFNGLRRLLARREYETSFTGEEIRVP